MATLPNKQLAEQITKRFISENIIHAKDSKNVSEKLALGTMSAEDWLSIIKVGIESENTNEH